MRECSGRWRRSVADAVFDAALRDRLQEQPAEHVADPEEHEDHDGDDHARRAPIIGRKRGCSSSLVHSIEHPRGCPGRAQQVGDQVDRAGREHDAAGAGELARARQRARAGRATISPAARRAGAPATASVGGGSARGFVAAR